MSYLELAKQVRRGRDRHDDVVSGGKRCARCRALATQGVRILICSACGYTAEPRPAPKPQPRDLVYSLAHVRQHLPGLAAESRDRFDYWLDLFLDAGWSREDSDRAAFQRAMRSVSKGPRQE